MPETDADTTGDVSASADDAPRRGGRRVAPLVALALAILFGGLFWVLAGAEAKQNEPARSSLLDRSAPPVVGEFADGTPFELARRQGSWVVLNFFTSTCIPCQREHPELIKFVDQQDQLGVDGAEFYSIVVGESVADVETYFAEYGGAWPVVYDPDQDFQFQFGVALVPETWIIDPNGIVRARFISTVTADSLSSLIQQMRLGFG